MEYKYWGRGEKGRKRRREGCGWQEQRRKQGEEMEERTEVERTIGFGKRMVVLRGGRDPWPSVIDG